MMLVGTSSTMTVVRTPNEFVKKLGEDRAAETADEHDVHHAHRDAEAAESVRAHGLQHRRDHRERARRQHRLAGCPR